MPITKIVKKAKIDLFFGMIYNPNPHHQDFVFSCWPNFLLLNKLVGFLTPLCTQLWHLWTHICNSLRPKRKRLDPVPFENIPEEDFVWSILDYVHTSQTVTGAGEVRYCDGPVAAYDGSCIHLRVQGDEVSYQKM